MRNGGGYPSSGSSSARSATGAKASSSRRPSPGNGPSKCPSSRTSPASPRRSCPKAARRQRDSASAFQRTRTRASKEGGALKASDLAAHKSDWVKPLEMNYRGYTLHEIPPNGQGIVALMALGMLENFDLRSHPVDGPDSVHLQIEAIKLAFADAWRYVADIDYMTEVKPVALLEREYLKSRAKLIDLKRAQDFGHGTPPQGGTVYLTAHDESGMMVSFIQ